MEKILIYTDRTKEQSFLKAVTDARSACNNLIMVFESFQGWKKITTLQEWINLVSDPRGYFDETLLQNIEIKATGGKKPEPALLAPMFGIDRESYLNLTTGKPVKSDCVPCQKVKIRKGTTAITLSDYQSHQDYLIFENGTFILNDPAIQTHLGGFKTYISTPAQLKTLTHWKSLLQILNQHKAKGYIGTSALELIGRQCGLRYVDGELYLNEESLNMEILKAK